LNMAIDNKINVEGDEEPKTQAEWAKLAQRLGIKAIHIAEHDE